MQRVLRSQADFRSTLLRNQLTSLVLFEAITTTGAKAKQLIPFVNRFFNRVKTADMNATRLANQTLLDPNAVKKVFEEVLPRFSEGETNFVREYKVMPRRGDNSPQTMVAFIRPLTAEKAKPTATKTVEKAAPKAAKKVAPKAKKA